MFVICVLRGKYEVTADTNASETKNEIENCIFHYL